MGPLGITLILFGSVMVSLLAGIPIAIALGGIGVLMIYLFWGPNALATLAMNGFSVTSSFEFMAIPLFIFMANMLHHSGLSDDLYATMYHFFGRLRGGLAAGTVVICTIFAAMAGISGAATISMGVVALPSMLNRGYSKDIALGSIAAGGSLGILIPPSVTMIVYGLVSGTSIGKLYAGGVLPGLMLSALFISYILIRSWLRPELAPAAVDPTEWATWESVALLKGLVFPLILVGSVLGSIVTGVASISEAAAVGALGSIAAAGFKGRWTWSVIRATCVQTLLLTCLIFWIIIGASALSTFYTAMGAASLIQGIVLGWDVNRYVILLGITVILLVMGTVIDTVGIIMITAPVFVPIIRELDFDLVWFGVLFIVNMEAGFLTPPFGYNLFYLKGVAPSDVTMVDIYRSVLPFILLMFFGMGLLVLFPEIVLVLPNALF